MKVPSQKKSDVSPKYSRFRSVLRIINITVPDSEPESYLIMYSLSPLNNSMFKKPSVTISSDKLFT